MIRDLSDENRCTIPQKKLHEVSKTELLLLFFTKCRSDSKFKHLDTLLGVLRYLILPADLPGHFEIFFD